jgi:threonine synthase
MGLPVETLTIATNDNDILARTLATGEYRMQGVVATTSPSMDIQISSNFERLLFEASGRNADTVRRYMNGLKQSGAFTIEPKELETIRAGFAAGRATMKDTAETIRSTLSASGYPPCPMSFSAPPTRPSSRRLWSKPAGSRPPCPHGFLT